MSTEFNTMIPIPGYPGYYATDTGYIYSEKRGRLRRLGGGITENGYIQVVLFLNQKRRPLMTHRLILLAFVGAIPEGMQTRHLNGIPTDNRLCNLKWGTPKENDADKDIHGTRQPQKGEFNNYAKLTEQKAREIKESALTTTELVQKYGVSRTTVCAVRRGALWGHI